MITSTQQQQFNFETVALVEYLSKPHAIDSNTIFFTMIVQRD